MDGTQTEEKPTQGIHPDFEAWGAWLMEKHGGRYHESVENVKSIVPPAMLKKAGVDDAMIRQAFILSEMIRELGSYFEGKASPSGIDTYSGMANMCLAILSQNIERVEGANLVHRILFDLRMEACAKKIIDMSLIAQIILDTNKAAEAKEFQQAEAEFFGADTTTQEQANAAGNN